MFIHYTSQGAPDQPVLLLSNSLGADITMWDDLTVLLAPRFRIIRYALVEEATTSSIPYEVAPEPTLSWLSGAVLALLDHLAIEKTHFCGLSMGGMVGQWLGLYHPERFHTLILSNTGAKIGTTDTWNDRMALVKEQGLGAIVDATMERWFTDTFRQAQSEQVHRIRTAFLGSNPTLYLLACAAIRDADFRADLGEISIPTLIIAGDEDPVTTLEHADFLVQHIPKAQLVCLPTRHLSAIEKYTDFAHAITRFTL